MNWPSRCSRNLWSSSERRLGIFRGLRTGSQASNAGPETLPKAQVRLQRINSRLPKFLRGYTAPLINAPVSHVSAFLVLHELTAIIPLFGLAGLFHYTQWVPSIIFKWEWAADGAEKFGKYFRRKGWLSEEAGDVEEHNLTLSGEKRTRVVLEFAAAYALTKVLLPLRLVLSVWCTPWFARVAFIPSWNFLQKLYSRIRKPQ